MYLNLDLLYNISNYPDFLYHKQPWNRRWKNSRLEKWVYSIKNQKMVTWVDENNVFDFTDYTDYITYIDMKTKIIKTIECDGEEDIFSYVPNRNNYNAEWDFFKGTFEPFEILMQKNTNEKRIEKFFKPFEIPKEFEEFLKSDKRIRESSYFWGFK